MIFKKIWLAALLLCCLPAFLFGQNYKGDFWQSVKQKKAGKIYILHYDRAPYVYTDEATGQLTGIEYDLANEIVRYLKKEYSVELEVEWVKFDNFKTLHEAMKKSEGGVFGLTSVASGEISDVQLSPAFMPDMEVLACSPDLNVAADKGQLRSLLNGAVPVTIAGSAFETNLKHLSEEYFPESKIEYADTEAQLVERIVKGSKTFGYIPLTEYYIAIRHGKTLTKQEFFAEKRSDYKIAYPVGSDWTEPLNDYFTNNKFKASINFIIKKHLGTDVQGLLWETPADEEAKKKLADAQHQASHAQHDLAAEDEEYSNFKRNALMSFSLLLAGLVGLGLWKVRSDKSYQRMLALKENALLEYQTELDAVTQESANHLAFAKHIQEAALPGEEKLKELFADGFVYYQPREKVSGDFYWFAQNGDEKIIAAFDSTGKGVAAAFVTLQSSVLMKEIVSQKNITEPSAILYELDRLLPDIIVHEGFDFIAKDGIEAAICTINAKTQTLTFAGAKCPVYFFSGGRMQQLKGNKFDIGNSLFKDKVFEPVTISYKPGDVFYLASDGYADQLGSDQKNRFLVKNFKEMLLENHDQPLQAQSGEMHRRFTEWKGSIRQTDDVMVIGVKL